MPPNAEQVERPADVARNVCAEYGVTIAAVKGRGRTTYLSRARKAVALALSRRTGLSAPEIASYLNRERSTVSYLLGRRKS